MCSMYEGMRNSSGGGIILGKDIVNVRWGSSVTSVENANVQQPTAPQGVVEEADDGITLMDLLKSFVSIWSPRLSHSWWWWQA